MALVYRILHLTDLHWDNESAEDQKLIISKLGDDLKSIVKDGKIDALVFSGDLVKKGQNKADFLVAKQELFEPIQRLFGLSNSEIFICAGNHDVDREVALAQNYVEAGLKAELKDSQSINKHVDRYLSTPYTKDDASTRLTNYFEFVRTYFNKGASFESSYVDCIIKRADLGNIGFALFNSAWRSVGAGDSEWHQLLMAERVIDKAAEHLKACDLRIAVIHHPLDWLAPWNQKSVQPPLFVHFDLVLFGHVHEAMPTLVTNTIGECVFAQGGTIYLHREYYNGYQLIDITQDDAIEFNFHLRTWFDQPRRAFGPAENICAGGRKRFQIRSTVDTQKRLRVNDLLAIQNATDELANSHFRALQLKNDATFDDSFTCPPLSTKTHEELLRMSASDYRKNTVVLSDLLRENGVLVFSGDRESGKTSIAWKIAKDATRSTERAIRVPILVDFSLIRKYDTIDRLVRRYITILNLDIASGKILAGHRCLFIVDNVSLADQEKTGRLKTLLDEYGNQHDWCIFLDQVELLSSKDIVNEFGAVRPPIFIQPFGRG